MGFPNPNVTNAFIRANANFQALYLAAPRDAQRRTLAPT